ncbi:MAG: acetoacetate--CoA ligase [Steroidobacteraceae bacterium]
MNTHDPIWQPTPLRIADANLTRYLAHRTQIDPSIGDYAALWQWSVDDPEAFWLDWLAYSGVIHEGSLQPVLVDRERMPGARWFPALRLNYAENLLRRSGPEPALVFCNEGGERREVSWDRLRAEVGRVAAGLRASGVVAGDVVAGFMPNLPETIIAMLASASIGATWTSCSPDFGLQGVLDRFGQVHPRVLFTADGYLYGGKRHDSLGRAAEIAAKVESIRQVVVVSYSGSDSPTPPLGVGWDTYGTPGAEPEYRRLAFDHPLFVMYSSGTTGVPKCIVHGAGGTLLQHLKEHQLHCDVKPADRLFFFTTCGWMMWNWLAGALGSGATLMLYEGSPFHPGPEVLWNMASAEGITLFGTSPRYLAALEKAGYRPLEHGSLARLRTVFSTGSPLAPEQYDFVHDAIGREVQLASITGGTDIISCFALGNPLLPVYRGEIQCRGLGMRVEVWNEAGQSVVDEQGELVCTFPFPSMPVGFWDDPEGSRYRAAYFERFPGVWHHGDYARLTSRGGLVVLGRSDAVLNPGGVRIGTAEIYRQVELLPEVLESVVIGQQWEGDVRVVLFVRLREGLTLDEALTGRIREQVRRNTTPRHVPARVLQVADVPRTRSGKIVEIAVRDAVHGRPVRNTEALANPEALEHFRGRPELQT